MFDPSIFESLREHQDWGSEKEPVPLSQLTKIRIIRVLVFHVVLEAESPQGSSGARVKIASCV